MQALSVAASHCIRRSGRADEAADAITGIASDSPLTCARDFFSASSDLLCPIEYACSLGQRTGLGTRYLGILSPTLQAMMFRSQCRHRCANDARTVKRRRDLSSVFRNTDDMCTRFESKSVVIASRPALPLLLSVRLHAANGLAATETSISAGGGKDDSQGVGVMD